MKFFCTTCNEVVGRPHGLGHHMVTFEEMTVVQKQSAARQLGTKLARMLKLDPMMIVTAFLSALEDANQHDFYRMVDKQWTDLLKH